MIVVWFFRQASLEQLQGELDEKDRELTELREFTALEAELKEQSFLEKLVSFLLIDY